MTVKRNGDKVVLKGGKVSCSCCAECCMYPAQALIDGFYTYEDLPDAIDFAGGGFSKLDPPEQRVIDGVSMTVYYGSTLEGVGIIDGGEGGWSTVVDNSFQIGIIGSCLITALPPPEGGEVSDQFADTYTITYQGDSAQVTRKSLCLWDAQTIDQEGTTVLWELGYSSVNNPEFPGYAKWIAGIQGLTTVGGIKLLYQNTPVGTYGLGITVS